jgi:hypothetical protein
MEPPSPPEVLFPLTLVWDNGEVETYGDFGDLQCNLECFHSDEDRDCILTDRKGRRVRLHMVTMDVRVLELEDFPGSDPRVRKVSKSVPVSGSKLVLLILLVMAVFSVFFLNVLHKYCLLPGW